MSSEKSVSGLWFGLSFGAKPLFPKASVFSAVIADMISRARSVGWAALNPFAFACYRLNKYLEKAAGRDGAGLQALFPA
jgi:hypothetical protein